MRLGTRQLLTRMVRTAQIAGGCPNRAARTVRPCAASLFPQPNTNRNGRGSTQKTSASEAELLNTPTRDVLRETGRS